MNTRLQKKCFFAATGFHFLLLVVLLFGSAFLQHEDAPKALMLVNVDPDILDDSDRVHGGRQNVQLPPPSLAQPTQPQPAAPKPPQPQLEKPQPPEPQKDNTPEVRNDKPVKDEFTLKNQKQAPKANLNPKKRDSGKQPTKQTNKPTDSTPESNERQVADIRKAISGAVGSLQKDLTPGIKVGTPGDGSSDFVTSGYNNYIQSIYQHRYDAELAGAEEVGERQDEVGVSVTVSRDGTVTASRITDASKNAALNKLVQRVLDKVKFVRPFPEKSSDSQRTFNIIFDLKPKKALG